MQIVQTAQAYDESSLAVCWEPHEDSIYCRLLPESSEFILNIDDENEEILSTKAVIRNRALVSKALRQKVKPGSKIILSNCARGSSQPDGLVYLWREEGQEPSAQTLQFHDLLLSTRFDSFSDEQLKILFFLMHENKDLIRKNADLQLELDRMKEPKPDAHSLLRESSFAQNLFPDRKVFRSWVAEKFSEIEPNAKLLERNFPKDGLEGRRKDHIDFLFQDSNHHYLLVEICFYSKGWQEDIMVYIMRLNEARKRVAKELAVNPMQVRRMMVTNSLLHGVRDACTINQVELVHFSGYYRLEKYTHE